MDDIAKGHKMLSHSTQHKPKLSNPLKIIDLYDNYLPEDGEDTIGINYSDRIFDINIKFRSKYTELAEEIILRFHNASSFIVVPFPGQNLFDEDMGNSYLSSLIQYQHSELIEETEIYRILGFKHKHYRIFFLSQNKAIYVIATSVEVIEVK